MLLYMPVSKPSQCNFTFLAIVPIKEKDKYKNDSVTMWFQVFTNDMKNGANIPNISCIQLLDHT